MSEIKEAPDQPGRWWVTRADGDSKGGLVKRDPDGDLWGFLAIPGDKWQNIDALEAERDAARQEVERLTQDLAAVGVIRDKLANQLASLRAKGETDKHESFVDHLATFLRKSPQNCTSVMKMADAFRDVHEAEARYET